MTTPTTDAGKFIETPEQLAWRTEASRLYNVEKNIRDEIALLPRTLELMMQYEKKHWLAVDAIMDHGYLGALEALYTEREKYKLVNFFKEGIDKSIATIYEEQRKRNDRKDPLNWDKYFLIQDPEKYLVNYLFNRDC